MDDQLLVIKDIRFCLLTLSSDFSELGADFALIEFQKAALVKKLSEEQY